MSGGEACVTHKLCRQLLLARILFCRKCRIQMLVLKQQKNLLKRFTLDIKCHIELLLSSTSCRFGANIILENHNMAGDIHPDFI